MAIQPRHRTDHTMVYLDPGDSAWDRDKIDAEIRAIRIKTGELEPEPKEEVPDVVWESVDEHPTILYSRGESRYDLDTVREYLIQDEKPTEFVLRRLKPEHYADVKDLLSQHQVGRARLKAIEMGLVEIRGDFPWKPKRNKATGFLRRDSIEDLSEKLPELEFDLLGYACITASSSLKDSEKKR